MNDKYHALDERTIPLFIATDEHKQGSIDSRRWFNNTNDICAVDLQLGDVCYDYYTESSFTVLLCDFLVNRDNTNLCKDIHKNKSPLDEPNLSSPGG